MADQLTPKEKMVAVRQYLQDGKTQQAKAILKTIDHPKAKEMLAELDKGQSKGSSGVMLYIVAAVMLLAGVAVGYVVGSMGKENSGGGSSATLCNFDEWEDHSYNTRIEFINVLGEVDGMLDIANRYSDENDASPECLASVEITRNTLSGMTSILTAFIEGDGIDDPDYTSGMMDFGMAQGVSMGYTIAKTELREATE